MWPFNEKQEEYKRGRGDSPINGRRYMIINGMSIDAVKAEYNGYTNEYVIFNSGLNVKQEDWKIIKEMVKPSVNNNLPNNRMTIKPKESTMKNNNRHQHHDLIVEWAKDTSKKLQGRRVGFGEWLGASVSNLTDAEPDYEFRIKPRELIKGHWYPCFFSDNDFAVMVYDGRWFYSKSSLDSVTYTESEFFKVGKSLGQIEFGGGE